MTVAASASISDVGQRRDHNEDAVVEQHPLYGIADGVGGAASGEEASRLALDVLQREAGTVTAAPDDAAARAAMEHAVLAANDAVFEAQRGDAERAGMATTVTVGVVRDDGSIVLGHVGDSRAYKVGGGVGAGAIEQVTDDHSVVGELLRSGRISHSEAAQHPHRNVITRALGSEPHLEVDTRVLRLEPGGWLLVCSDGLTEHVEDHEIARAVAEAASPDEALARLVDQANARGGTDNISIVLVQPIAGERGAAAGRTAALASVPAEVEGANPAEISGEIAITPRAPDATPRGTGATPTAADDPLHEPLPPASEGATGRPRWRVAIAIVALLLVGFAVGALAWRQSYFLLERSDGRVGIDQGFPVDGLHRTFRTSNVRAADLSSYDRDHLVKSKTLRSKSDAEKVLGQLPGKLPATAPGGAAP